MRWDYDQTISGYTRDKKYCTENNNKILDEVHSFEALIKVQTDIISDQYKNTVNIDESIVAINNGLVDLGIDNIRIKKHSNNLYKIDRDGQEDDTFKTLSEGEKMVISFLYFLELCKGKKSATDTVQKKIVVIDDPISSLSHIYVFNIGRLIKNVLLRSNTYEQVFVLTHSLYFFYELTDTNHGDRKVTQKLFRMYKNCNGSHITEMKYEEIQNDYHSYWHIIKDKQQSPALIANCMRNIIEYFFNFIEKKDLSNVMNIPVLQDTKYQAFWRYINRESHSLGQNIFDIKEFDYEAFKDAFRLVFECCGYNKHYEKMMKL